MKIDILRLLIDFGLFILIWVVQLVIYPSLSYYAVEDCQRWHNSYTRRITIIVMPLMFIQLGIVLLQFSGSKDYYTFSSLFLVILVWLHTFLIAIPLHGKVDTSSNTSEIANRLTKTNWYRTIIWSLLFVLSLWQRIS